ncbi:MAG TPA: DUF2277 domain-containing protein [Candidatus Limnocylindrales bacterium]|nr:DUF2277 domain-containing protein [Candidatus Limnocylindrales bacterium]
MCRSIRTLRSSEVPATTGEIEAAARQYVRKVSGFRAPSARNEAAFSSAIAEIAAASQRLLLAVGGEIEDGPDRKPPARAAGHEHPDAEHVHTGHDHVHAGHAPAV